MIAHRLRPPLFVRPAACAAVLLGASALPAAAQFYGPGYGYVPYGYGYGYNAPPPPPGYGPGPYGDGGLGPRPIPPRRIVERLEDMGYEDVGRPRFTGTLYLVDATGPGDIRMQVTVDAIRGIVLNRTVLGDPRRPRLRDEDDDDRGPRRRSAERPIEPAPLPREPRGGPPAVASRGLPTPADPRLEPGPAEAARKPPATRPDNREARTTPAKPLPAEPGGQPYGVNPDSAKPAPARKPPVGEARRTGDAPNPKDLARKPVPSAPEAARPAEGGKPTVQAETRPNRPVRVIEGVTPPVAAPAPAPAPDAQLLNLPPPPAAPQPGAGE